MYKKTVCRVGTGNTCTTNVRARSGEGIQKFGIVYDRATGTRILKEVSSEVEGNLNEHLRKV